MKSFSHHWLLILGILAAIAVVAYSLSTRAVELPNPTNDSGLEQSTGSQTIVISGGCFWGIQAVFQHVKGVTKAISGYAGGAADTAKYDRVSTGTTGHAESVQVVYDPSIVSLGQLLKVFFTVAHDPTELNRQGPDVGPQYRSAIFYSTPKQQEIADVYIAQLDAAKVFPEPIVTKVVPLNGFYPAEAYHQDFAINHPDNAYIVANDLPKVANLRRQFPELYMGK